jgi:hypothetical protein
MQMQVSLRRFASLGVAMAAVVVGALFLLFGPLFGDRITNALQDACLRGHKDPRPYCTDPP